MHDTKNYLDEVYNKLGYDQGILLSVMDSPDINTSAHWVDKGGWLSLANNFNKSCDNRKIDKIFFVKDNPVIVFGNCSGNQKEIELFLQKAWCLARPIILYLAIPGELRVYSLNKLPNKGNNYEINDEPIERIQDVSRISKILSKYHREQVESGKLFEDTQFGKINDRADQRLIQDLKIVRAELIKAGLSGDKVKYAHALIGRSIFIRYLEDRGILTWAYYEKVANQNPRWQAILDTPIDRLFGTNVQNAFFLRLLKDKEFTYAFLKHLAKDFNGDMFPQDTNEYDIITQDHLDILRGFLIGDTGPQCKVFFWAYSFDIIPTELISSIYEEFYRQGTNIKATGTYYTPPSLVDFVLSQVLTSEVLDTTPRILDPACGSGIFLVESFRRIVRYEEQKRNGSKLSAEELKGILRQQIRGIEINEEALRISAFSLYLAYLNYQEPPDITQQLEKGYKLPNLKYRSDAREQNQFLNILLESDTFDCALIDQNAEMFDHFGNANVLVGNPPWGKISKKALDWCKLNNLTIGHKEFSQAFILRSLTFLSENGIVGMLVSSGVILKQQANSIIFRRTWLTRTELVQVVNFSHVRHVFFKNANSPFAYIQFRKKVPDDTNLMYYWSAKKTAMVENQQAIVLTRADLKLVKQTELTNNDNLWKIFWWGNHKDYALLSALSLNDSLRRVVEKRGWTAGRGFQLDFANGSHKPSEWLKNYKELPIEYFSRYGTIEEKWLKEVPDIVHRRGKRAIYEGQRIIVGQGIIEADGADGKIIARLEQKSYAVSQSFYGISMSNAEDWECKIILGIIWSSLARYILFLTATSWGSWRHKIYLEEILDLPIRFPNNEDLKVRIINTVNKLLVFDSFEQMVHQDTNVMMLEKELDDAIFEMFALSEPERDLITDMCNTGLDVFYNGTSGEGFRPLIKSVSAEEGLIKDTLLQNHIKGGIEGYINAFLEVWNEELEPDGEFSWKIFGIENASPIISIVFSTRSKSEPILSKKNDYNSLQEIFRTLDKSLLIPLSSSIYIEGMCTIVSDTNIIVIKKNERRLWTKSAAREDAESTLLQVIDLQEQYNGGLQ